MSADGKPVPQVYAAINAVQADLAKTGISKDRENQQGAGFKFRGIDDIFNALSPLLSTHGLCILPRIISREATDRQSKSGGALFYVVLQAEFDFVAASDGSMHTIRTYGEAMDSSDKATNKAMSAAYKYACIQAFCIPIVGVEDDADKHTHGVLSKAELELLREKQTVLDELTLASDGGLKALEAAYKRLKSTPPASMANRHLKEVWAAHGGELKAVAKENDFSRDKVSQLPPDEPANVDAAGTFKG
jgi:hypothetical protein